MYTYIDGYIHLHHKDLSRRTQITLTDRQHAFLAEESFRSGLPMAELVRRAIDTTYRPHRRPRLRGFEINFGLWPEPDAAVLGRRPPRQTRLSEVP